MALDRQYRVRCDQCGKLFVYAWERTPRTARAEARRHGWTSMSRGTDGYGGYGFARLDYCPDCAIAAEQETSDDGNAD